MTITRIKLYAAVAAASMCWAIGLLTGWSIWHNPAPAPETYQKGVVQSDLSVILERKPQADARPAQQVPPRSVIERVVRVTVQPDTVLRRDTIRCRDTLVVCPPCPRVSVDLTLVRLRDSSRRVIASSPDGRVIAGVDVPVERSVAQRTLNWSAGAVYGLNSSIGGYLHRDIGPFRIGASGTRKVNYNKWQFAVEAGLRF